MGQLFRNLELPKPWYWTTQDLTNQLKKEISSNHILYKKEISTLARREDNDDALFLVENKQFAVVHLTWSNNSHKDGRWPITKLFETWEDFLKEI